MAKVVFVEGGKVAKQDENLCGQCALKGNCPLREGQKKLGIIDTSNRTIFCGYFKPEDALL